jgi:type IV secretory pathway VirB10-like protein
MMRPILFSAALVVVAGAASAQDPFTAAKKAAQNAAAATNAHIEAEQRPDDQQKSPAKKSAPAPTQQSKSAPSKPAPTSKTSTPTKGAAAKPAIPVNPADTAGPPPSIYREVFDYTREGRRDPFNSLLTTSELRPTMSDLRLTGVLFDPSNRRSGATLRDIATNTQYRVNVGSTLGRMRVSSIRNKTVVFTIEEFGTTRQDSLVLGDSTKVRRP